MSAREKGATVLTRTKFVSGEARRRRLAGGTRGHAQRRAAHRHRHGHRQRRGPVGVAGARRACPHKPTGAKVRLVKGSHIVVPKVHSLGHACILQNTDKRVIFVIPFEGKWSLIGTTDVPVDTPEEAVDITRRGDRLPHRGGQPLPRQADLARPTSSGPSPACARSTTTASPTRPRSRATTCSSWTTRAARPRCFRVFGGKITTYRCLAETALEKLAPLPAAHGRRAGPRRRPCPAATCATTTPSATRCSSATRASRATCSTASSAATAAARRMVLGDAQSARGARHELRRRPHRARDRLPRRRRVGRDRRGHPLAAHQVRPAHGRGAARRRRRLPRQPQVVSKGRCPSMKPLAEFPLEARRAVRGVLADIDDTLTTHGRLHAVAYSALERLREAGLLVIPVTGRPAGWCDHIARMWPVDAVVGENGAFWFRHDAVAGKLVKRYVDRGRGARAPRRSAWTPSPRASWRRCRAAASPPTSPTARPTSPSTSARTCRGSAARRWRASSRSWSRRGSPPR